MLLRARGRSERSARLIAEDEARRAAAICERFPGGVPVFELQETARGLRFRCPVCRTVNLHGGPPSHRASHCACWPGGYVLVVREEEQTP